MYPVSGFGLCQLQEPVWLMTLNTVSAGPVSVAVAPADPVLTVSVSAGSVSAVPAAVSAFVLLPDLHI